MTAVVILNFNGKKHLASFLPSVVANTKGAEIVVADNHSGDDSIAFIKETYPSIRIIALPENYGFAGGYNEALKQVKADEYILLNSDVKTPPGWITEPLKLLRSSEKIAAVQPKIKSYIQPDYFEHAGAAGGFIDQFGFPFCRGRLFSTVEKDNGQYNQSGQVFWASGACLFIKANAFHEAGGFDADFFAHMEEIDLCWRLLNKGYQIHYCAESEVYHLGGGTLPYSSPRKTFLNFRNNLFLLLKNLPQPLISKVVRRRIALDTIAGAKFLAGGELKLLQGVWKAHREFFRDRKRFLAKRDLSETHRFDYDQVYRGSIVKDYFISGRKKFSDLPFAQSG